MKPIKLASIFSLFFLILFGFATGPSAKEIQFTYNHGFTGVNKCKKCHKKKKEGEQFKIWKASKHAKAYETLASDDSKKYAKEMGIDNPQQAKDCLICHVTAFDAPKELLAKKFKIEDGVQCERCHGPGKDYGKKKVMKKISKEMAASNKTESATAEKTGLTHPTEEMCLQCHVESITYQGKEYKNPAYKEFDFKKAFDEIAHFKPKKE